MQGLAKSILLTFFFFLVVLGLELRASSLLGRLSPTWALVPQSILEHFEGYINNTSMYFIWVFLVNDKMLC
jgi:hypothetical protein